jgi:hypothetical protein
MRKGLKTQPSNNPIAKPPQQQQLIIKPGPFLSTSAAAAAQASATSASSQPRDRIKNTCTVSARMRQVVEQMLACDPEQYALAMQQTTIFAFKSQQSELILSFLQDMRRENRQLYQNKAALLQVIGEAYDKTQAVFFAL